MILKYSKPGELVLDYFCGAGTTAVECKLLGRKCVALDINYKAIELAKKNIDFSVEPQQQSLFGQKQHFEVYEPRLIVGDARDLSFIEDNSIDLICAHPPYANIIHYTDRSEGDLSFFDIDEFLKEMSKVAKESFRVLKPGRQCAILIGDTRSKKHVIPLGFKLIDVYLSAGFKLRELIVKQQHNCKTTGFWYTNSIKYNFLLLAHEYLPVFEKPAISIPAVAKEENTINYDLFIPYSKNPSVKSKSNELETTTVWSLPEKDFEEHLNRNVIERYSNGSKYSIINFVTNSNEETTFFDNKREKNKALLFIKLPLLDNNLSNSNIELYLQKIKEIVNNGLPTIIEDGFIVIQTQDVRIDGYVKPLAKELVNELTNDDLWLKEIVIVTQEGVNSKIQNLEEYLKIVHQYLLVYEVIK